MEGRKSMYFERNEQYPASRVVTEVPGTEVGVGDATTAQVRIMGPKRLVELVDCSVEGGVLYITKRAGTHAISVVNTGPAIVGEGGSANTGVMLTGQPDRRRRRWLDFLRGPAAPRITVSNTGPAIAGPHGRANTGYAGVGESESGSDELKIVVELPRRK